MGQVIFVYAMFFLGYLLHMGLQVDAVVRAKNNAACSRLSTIRDNAIVLAARLFIAVIVFWFMRAHPQFLGTLVGYLGITLSPGIGAALNAESWGVAGMFGYVIDSILTFIPFLKNYVPPLNGLSTPGKP